MLAAAALSLAAIRDRNKFGMAMAAMIRMIATTIKSSIRENPLALFIGLFASTPAAGGLGVMQKGA
jgi:hypothetical protein